MKTTKKKMTLFGIIRKKEVIHWKRTKDMFLKFDGLVARLTLGIIAILLGTIYHYGLVAMSTGYECVLYVFNRSMYRANIERMSLTI
jgi:hypothetical protein